MIADWVRQTCLALPHTTESVQWGNNLVFKIGGKIYAVAPLDAGGLSLSLKCSPETFAELTEREGVIPAPYLARAHWVALERDDAIPRGELRELLNCAYDLVLAKLPKKTKDAIRTKAKKP